MNRNNDEEFEKICREEAEAGETVVVGGFKPPKPRVVGRSNGHIWVEPTGVIPGVFCKKCLMMRRRDGKNGKCTGHARLRL